MYIKLKRLFNFFYIGPLYAIDCGNFLSEPKPVNRLGSKSLKEIFENGILWAVPKHRRSLEIRHKRRFGILKYVWKPLVTKTNILMCLSCGHHYEANRLCGKCYMFGTKIYFDFLSTFFYYTI